MKKKLKMDNIDCANCAREMEDAINKIDGVNSAKVNFMTQKFMLEAADDVYDKVLDEAIKACKKVEPDCEIETA